MAAPWPWRSNAPTQAADPRGSRAARSTRPRSRPSKGGAGETVALDVGTSVLALAEELVARDDLRVFTNNLRAAIALTRSRSPVYLLGGHLRGPELAVVGPAATTQVNDYYFDRV